jgi:tRNA nucleotidyltransferase (CCA-adding enzyme)
MKEIKDFFQDIGEIYFVGGCVRDLVLGIEPHDYDLITKELPIVIESYIRSKGRKPWLQGKRFGTIGVKLNGEIIEVTTYRKELYDFKSRKPIVSYSNNLTDDLNRRDYTINTLVCDMEGNIKNYLGGIGDIKNKVLRSVGNPKKRFQEDPLRILRGIRFSNKYGLRIEDKTYEKMIRCRWELLRLSKERVVEEINKCFELPCDLMKDCMIDYFEMFVFQIIIPELHLQWNYDQNSKYHDFNLDMHTVQVLGSVRKETKLTDEFFYAKMWSALLHDISKPLVRTIHKSGTYCNYINHELLGSSITNRLLIDYKFRNKDREFIVNTVENHLNEDSWLRKHDNKHKKKNG